LVLLLLSNEIGDDGGLIEVIGDGGKNVVVGLE
jgi:hypothetical protein